MSWRSAWIDPECCTVVRLTCVVWLPMRSSARATPEVPAARTRARGTANRISVFMRVLLWMGGTTLPANMLQRRCLVQQPDEDGEALGSTAVPFAALPATRWTMTLARPRGTREWVATR